MLTAMNVPACLRPHGRPHEIFAEPGKDHLPIPCHQVTDTESSIPGTEMPVRRGYLAGFQSVEKSWVRSAPARG
jgi:hypothetical protein